MGPGILRTQGIQSRIRGHGSFLSKQQLALLNLNTYVRRVCLKVYAKCSQQDNATKRSGGMLENIFALGCRVVREYLWCVVDIFTVPRGVDFIPVVWSPRAMVASHRLHIRIFTACL